MSANPIDKNSTPKPTGSLEDLFRHHLGEEAAVVLPRPMLWDQIDNSLLIRQNETYRRRLVATRWVAAASLLLATLAGTGWWATRYGSNGPEIAATSQPVGRGLPGTMSDVRTVEASGSSTLSRSTSPMMVSASRPTISHRGLSNSNASASALATRAISDTATTATNSSSGLVAATEVTATTRSTGFNSGAMRNELSQSVASGSRNSSSSNFGSSARSTVAVGGPVAITASRTQLATIPDAVLNSVGSPDATSSSTTSQLITVGSTATSATADTITATANALAANTTPTPAGVAAPATTAAGELAGLAARPAALSLSIPAALPEGLVASALSTKNVLPPAVSKWSYGASYTASTFNPNINFSRVGLENDYGYNPALGPNSPALTEAAATEYRQNLRPGFSQRLALLATRHLAGHWSLSTGAEFTQATAKSATNTGFVGEQLYDLGSYGTGPQQTTNYRYRLASIPAELRYANAAKRGLSIYGRLGGVVSALLGVRSEVEGNPEATRTYSFLTAGAPYRRILASVRGGAGAQFRPRTGNWAFTLGPVAELALVPLNAHPAQSYLSQSRSYSFGLEAGMEFGR